MRRIQKMPNSEHWRIRPFINIKFESRPFTTGEAGNYRRTVTVGEKPERMRNEMKRTVLALTTESPSASLPWRPRLQLKHGGEAEAGAPVSPAD